MCGSANDSASHVVDDIFEKVASSKKIFKNKEVLFHDHVPDRLSFRDQEIEELAFLLSPLLKGQRSSNVFIYGKTGTGKTAVARFVLSRLQAKLQDIDVALRSSYINCRNAGTEYRVASSLADSVDVDVPFTGLSVEEVFSRFREGFRDLSASLLLVLDEIDALVSRYGDDLLYSLTRINAGDGGKPIMLVGISNDVRFKEYLDPRVLSSLGEEELVFRPYTPEELEEILRERSTKSFREGVVPESTLSLCAAISAAEHGDARKALDLLRVAGEIAERQGAPEVAEDHVRAAQKSIERDRVTQVISTLPLHSKVVLAAVVRCLSSSKGRAKSSTIYGKYSSLAKELAGRALTSRRVYGLLRELSVAGILDKRIDNYGRRGGRVTTVSLEIPMSSVKDALRKDPLIGDLFSSE